MNDYVKVIVVWLLVGLIGCALIAYPTYDRKGTVDVALPIASVLGPLTLVIGIIHVAGEGYTTIYVKEGK